MSDLKQTRAHYEGLVAEVHAPTYHRADMWQGWDDDEPTPARRILGYTIADIVTLFIVFGLFWCAVFEVAL